MFLGPKNHYHEPSVPTVSSNITRPRFPSVISLCIDLGKKLSKANVGNQQRFKCSMHTLIQSRLGL